MIEKGYIKLWRSLLNWEWHDDPNTLALYVHLMLMASIAPSNWHGIEIPRGCVVSSLAKICSQTGLTFQQARTAINHLEATGEVTRSTYPQFTVFTLINYDKFQEPTNKSTNKQQTTNKQTNKRPTNDQQQYKKIKEDKEYYKEKINKKESGSPALEEQSTAAYSEEVARVIRERDF